MTEFYCFVAAERPSCGGTKFYYVAIKIYLTSISRRHRIFLVSILWRHGILSRFGTAEYPFCGDAVCLNLTRLASRRYCERRHAF
ncbi:hypothetical protein [uncultured Campylobacter sp.]|uniref:hypothetical protein n=1 Tax=uncultured Campylobacter sp. TaxID=218934 RepID=UPI00263166CF|nr:hypothetical protein [uncultured Campylobacter sp.]